MTIPPHTRLAIDWTCLSFAYCVFVLRLWALYTRGRGRIHYLNEFFLTLVTVMSTISGIMGTWRMSQAMRYAYMKSDPPVGFIKTLGLPYDVAVVDQKVCSDIHHQCFTDTKRNISYSTFNFLCMISSFGSTKGLGLQHISRFDQICQRK